jgi:lauroyl/myristoyl acyltransferase
MTAIRELRRGSIMVVLYDLPERFGRTVEIEFFGRRANFVRGPAEIALLGNADILPVFTHYDATGASIVEAMPVIAARAVPAGERARRTADIAQRLCTLAEQQIRAHPSQWAHWSFVRELLSGAGAIATISS